MYLDLYYNTMVSLLKYFDEFSEIFPLTTVGNDGYLITFTI